METKPLILNIETSTNVCSVALTKGNDVLNYIEDCTENSHSKRINILIDTLFQNTYYNIQDICAVSVSKGPGSYTGLRIGVSVAKGISYGLNIPLIGINTLEILALACSRKYKNCWYLAMIDARRMEVYTDLFDENLHSLKGISADIIDSDIYATYKQDKIVLCGSGAAKCKNVLINDRYVLDKVTYLKAESMAQLSYKKYINKEFEDTAYFEPYYLKEFIAIKSKVKGLY